MHSLRSRLFGLWVLSLAACVAVGVLLVQLYQQSTSAQVGRAQAVVARACDLIRDLLISSYRDPRARTGSLMTRRWREMDSNLQFRARLDYGRGL